MKKAGTGKSYSTITFASPSQNEVEKEKQKNKKGYCKGFCVTSRSKR